MDLHSNYQSLEVSDLQKEDGSDSVGKLDLNIVASKDAGQTEVYSHVSTVSNDRRQVDFNQQEHQGSPLLAANGCSGELEYSRTRPSLVHPSSSLTPGYSLNVVRESNELPFPNQKELGDDVERTSYDNGRKRPKSSLKDNYATDKEETVGHGDYSGNLSSPVLNETFHDEMETGGSARGSSQLPSVVDNYYQGEETARENFQFSTGQLHHHEGGECPGNNSSNLVAEKAGSINEEMTEGNSDQHIELPLRLQGLPSENGEEERADSDFHSPVETAKASASLARQMSVTSERSPVAQSSAGHKKVSPEKASQESSCLPGRQKCPPSPERTGSGGKRVPFDCSNTVRQTSTSPRRLSSQYSQHRDTSERKRSSASPRRQHSPPGQRRRDRSGSQSPIRRKDSTSRYKRDHSDRSRSRSPNVRDRYRRSPRRYSPRRKSPPRYHSRHRSPRRAWSPPSNRSTGVGRPGKNLFVAGFSFVTTERDLERKFSRFGRVTGVRIVRDKRTGDSRGFGFLSLERDEDADAAIRALDQMEWNGRIVLVEKSKTHSY